MSPGGFADPEVRARAAEARKLKAEERRQRKARPDRAPSGRRLPISKVQVQHGVSAVIIGIDAGLAYLAPDLWVTDPIPENSDRLTEREIAMLTEAFSDEAMKHPRVLRFLAQLTSITDRMGIAGALMLVALPRLARRGMLPRAFVPVLRDLLGAATAAEFNVPPAAPAPQPPQQEEPGPNREAA
ncbi:MAG: hypothetical protein HY323_08145 [Betaproteobacteria bacterium]|nr:hypothetical protein [Betaproteobacteria bacterium]